MPWPFCPCCRNTLTAYASGDVRCSHCDYRSNLSNMPSSYLPSIVTVSNNTAVPLWAKSDDEQKSLAEQRKVVRATVEEPCLKCGWDEVGFYTMQLRSVDEGQTVFYECPHCRFTWSVNN